MITRSIRTLLAAAVLLAPIAGCGDKGVLTSPEPTPELTGPVLRNAVTEGPVDGRLHLASSTPVRFPGASFSVGLNTAGGPTLAQIALVDPPIVDRVAAQASSIRSLTLGTQHLVIVGYNTKDGNKGAIDIFNVNNPSAPVLIQSLLFSGTAINAIAVTGTRVYMAEGTTDAGLGGTAVIETMVMGSNGAFKLPFQRLSSPGNVGTGVDVVNGVATLVTGENGGISQFTVDANGVLVRKSAGLTGGVRDARAVVASGVDILAVAGSAGGSSAGFSRWVSGGSLVSGTLPGLTDAGAKADLFIDRSSEMEDEEGDKLGTDGTVSNGKPKSWNSTFAFSTLGLGGVAVIDHRAGALRSVVSNPPATNGVNPIDVRANGVTGIPGYLFVSYGGLGVGLLSVPTTAPSTTTSPAVTVMGTYQLTPAVSANGIGCTYPNALSQGNVFVATGTGLRVLSYSVPVAAPTS